MYCQKCGAQNDANAFKCTQCSEVLAHAGTPAAPTEAIPNYLAQSVLVTLCCCMPVGIAAIVFSSQVNGKLASGDIEGAKESSRKAKLCAYWAFGLGILLGIIQILLTVAKDAAKVAN